MKNSETKLRVRYSETDQMGIVYYGNYAQYLEQGRTDWLRSLGLTYKFMEEHQVMLPVINLNIDYKKPAKYDDLLTIKTSLLEIPSVKIKFYYEIYNQCDELLVTATTSLVFLDSITRELIKAPGYLLEKLR